MVADHVPCCAGGADTGAVDVVPSPAVTDTLDANGCATPATTSDPPATEPGTLVSALWAYGALEAQSGIGPLPPCALCALTTVLAETGAPNSGVSLTETVSPGRRSGVTAEASAPFCQQSPFWSSGVATVVLTENGRKADGGGAGW